MKDDETHYSEVPKPPKGMGISRRLLFSMAGGSIIDSQFVFVFYKPLCAAP